MLGGTAWLGQHIVRAAVSAGDEVVCLARGVAGSVPDGATLVIADRDQPGAYQSVAGGPWDVVADVSSQPGRVREAVTALAAASGTFVLVSSVSVYQDNTAVNQDETAPTLQRLEGDVMESLETYGQAKVACETHVLDRFGPERSLVARAGLIGGPGDMSDRTGYWPLRFRRPAAPDGTVLVPDAPVEFAQVIDVRDLAGWLLQAARERVGGIFNLVGEPLPLAAHLELARSVAGHEGPLVAAPGEWLLARGVQPWFGERSLPLWTGESAGFGSRSLARARAAGLVLRPLQATLADTLAWEIGRDQARPRRAGLAPDDERALLAELAADGL
ncbi:MAG: oxidoreductase [Candidatus Dormibacteria bacterium]